MLRKIIVRLAPLFGLVDILIMRVGNRTKSENTDTVAIVRLDAIGDFIIWLDSAKEFRKYYADKKIILICNSVNKGIAESTGMFHKIITLNTKELIFPTNFRHRLRLRKQFADMSVEQVIQVVHARRIYADYIVSAISASRKITIEDSAYDNTAKWQEKLTNRIYTDVISVVESNPMEIQRNATFTRKIVSNDFKSSVPYLKGISIDREVIPKKDYFVIFPGGSLKAKMWPIERYAEVASYINSKTGWICCICGSINEKYLADYFKRYYSKEVFDMTGETSLVESIEVIRYAKILIGNDTSGIHFAAATDTPALCIAGGWHFGRFLPYYVESSEGRFLPQQCFTWKECYNCKMINRTAECKQYEKQYGLLECIADVTVEQVMEKLKQMLEAKHSKSENMRGNKC